MTTMTRRPASAGGSPAADPPSPEGRGRFAEWVSSWRIALRMARRDARRHLGRSVVVLIMVGVPTGLLTAGLTIGASSLITEGEQIPYLMGPGQAYLSEPDTFESTQPPDPSAYAAMGVNRAAVAVPGYDRGEDSAGSPVPPLGDPAQNARAMGALTDRPTTWIASGLTRATVGDRGIDTAVLATPEPQTMSGRVELISGRWPRSTEEALVIPFGQSAGLPSSGVITIRPSSREPATEARSLTIVGTVRALSIASTPGLVTTDLAGIMADVVGYVVFGDRPVDWAEVQRLNTYGITVWSRDVLLNPPASGEVSPERTNPPGAGVETQLIIVGGTLLLVMTALLVGPAFAISATRQRRTLALAACQGATPQQLRRSVLANAIVLGGLSAIIGACVGLVAAFVAWWAVRDGASPFGPFDIPVGGVLAVLAIAVAASLIAALAPARRLSSLDIIAVVKGGRAAPPPRRSVAFLGLVIAGLSGAYVLWAAYHPMAYSFLVALPVITLVLGSMLVVPLLLDILGRIGRLLRLPLRLASRDLSRHRSRSAPTIAAVLAGTAALTVGLIGSSSDSEQRRLEYTQRTAIGEVIVEQGEADPAEDLPAQLRRQAPSITWVPTAYLIDPGADQESSSGAQTVESTAVMAVPAGCSPLQTARQGMDPNSAMDPSSHVCVSVGSGSSSQGSIAVMPADEIIRRFGLDGSPARQIRDGGAMVLSRPGQGDLGAGGTITLVTATTPAPEVDPDTGGVVIDPDTGSPPFDPDDVTVTRETTTPAIVRPASIETLAAGTGATVVLPAEFVADQKWATTPASILGHRGAAISPDLVADLQTAVGDRAWIELEQGYQDPMLLVTTILLGIFAALLLVVTLTSTALSLAEQEQDQATLAAVGADRRTRRLMAGTQTWVLAAVGVVLGVLIGFVPGVAIAIPLTAQAIDPVLGSVGPGDPTIVIPWIPLLIIVAVIPAIAGLLAAALVRRSPDATRRAR